MSRRKVTRSVVAVAASAVLLAACGGDGGDPAADGGGDAGGGDAGDSTEETITIRMGSTATPEHSYTRALEGMLERVEDRLGDRVEFDLAFSGVLGSERDMTEQVQRGELDIGWISDIGMSSVVPEIGFVTLPYLFPSYDDVDEHYFGGFLGEEVEERLLARDLQVLGWLENDYRALTNSVRPVETVEDLQGLSLRVPEMPMMEDLFRELGASPTPIAVTELLTALQQGTVDGQDNGIILTWSFGFHEPQDFYTDTQHIYSGGAVIVSPETWESWPQDVRDVLAEEFELVGEEQRELNRADVEEFQQELVAAGIEFTALSDAERARFVEIGQSLWERYEDDYGTELMDRIRGELGG